MIRYIVEQLKFQKGLFSIFVQPEEHLAEFGTNQKLRTSSLRIGRVYYQFPGQFLFILVTMATELDFREILRKAHY